MSDSGQRGPLPGVLDLCRRPTRTTDRTLPFGFPCRAGDTPRRRGPAALVVENRSRPEHPGPHPGGWSAVLHPRSVHGPRELCGEPAVGPGNETGPGRRQLMNPASPRTPAVLLALIAALVVLGVAPAA